MYTMSILDAYTQTLTTKVLQVPSTDISQKHIPYGGYGMDGHAVRASVDMWTQALGQQTRRESPRGYVLEHRRRVRYVYGGLRYTTLQHLAKIAAGIPGSWARTFIALLEQRLDMVLCRAWWCQGPRQARIYIRRGSILVNGVPVYRSSYQLSPGDVVSIVPTYRETLQRTCIEMWNTHRVEPVSKASTYTHGPLSTKEPIGNAYDIISRALQHGYCTYIPKTHLVSLTPGQSTATVTTKGNWHHIARTVCHVLMDDTSIEKVLWPILLLENPYTSTTLLEGSPMYAYPHLEVQYSTMSLVYLYTPQYITWPCLVDLEALRAHL
nr:30S ribosomal protein S4 [Picochlorum sp. 'soloecismus']